MRTEEAIEQIQYLKEISAKSRLIAAYGYPSYILWGIITAIGYLGSLIFKTHLFWLIIIAGVILSFFIRTKAPDRPGANRLLKQLGLQSLIIISAGIVLFLNFFRYNDPLILNSFPPFLFGVVYLVDSVHMGLDLAFLGLWMVITAAISMLFPYPFQDIWLAVTFSGGLVFTGILFKIQIRKIENKIGK